MLEIVPYSENLPKKYVSLLNNFINPRYFDYLPKKYVNSTILYYKIMLVLEFNEICQELHNVPRTSKIV